MQWRAGGADLERAGPETLLENLIPATAEVNRARGAWPLNLALGSC